MRKDYFLFVTDLSRVALRASMSHQSLHSPTLVIWLNYSFWMTCRLYLYMDNNWETSTENNLTLQTASTNIDIKTTLYAAGFVQVITR